jgi:hypothetical protein
MTDTAQDYLHYGVKAIAKRCFGSDDELSQRRVYRWQNELPPEKRPPFLIKVGRHLAAWESAIQRHAAASRVSQQPE